MVYIVYSIPYSVYSTAHVPGVAMVFISIDIDVFLSLY